ncbi:MAG: hypothetical protein M1837_007427 [Sclerophora amabilis]|nr:MAG: hypothetical protein M1837_007427 [Sclerophora amabilis]
MNHLHQHRTSLLNNFTQAYAQLECDLRSEIAEQKKVARQEKQKLEEEIHTLRKEASGVQRLKNENDELRSRLQSSFPPLRTSGESPPQCAINHAVTRRDHQGHLDAPSRAEHDQLLTKYHKLRKDYECVYESLRTLKTKCRRDRENFKGWKTYWERRGHRESTDRDLVQGKDSRGQGKEENKESATDKTGAEEDLKTRVYQRSSSSSTSELRTAIDLPGHTAKVISPLKPSSKINELLDRNQNNDVLETKAFRSLNTALTDSKVGNVKLHSPRIKIQNGEDSILRSRSSGLTPEYTQHKKSQRDSMIGMGVDWDCRRRNSAPNCLSSSTTAKGIGVPGRVEERPDLPPSGADLKSSDRSGQKRKSELDEPMVLSERKIKRRREVQNPRRVHRQNVGFEEGGPNTPIEIKNEALPSSSWSLPEFQNHDSLDLDEVGQTVRTPKKQRALQQMQVYRRNFSHTKDAPSDTNCPEKIAESFNQQAAGTFEALRSSGFKNSTENQNEGSASNTNTPHLPLPLGLSTLKGGRPFPSNASDKKDQRKEKPSMTVETAVLQPQSPNVRLLPRTNDSASARSRPRRFDRREVGAHRIHHMTEDGEEFLPKSQKASGGVASNPQQKASTESEMIADRRLDSLLKQPSPRNPTLIGNSSLQTKTDRVKPESPTLTPKRRIETPNRSQQQPHGRSSFRDINPKQPGQGLGFPDRASAHLPNPTKSNHLDFVESPQPIPSPPCKNLKTLSASERLRAQPISQLTPENFKVNPNCNTGFEYAFSETVRNRDDRRCLPGCTRPACCGNVFRKIVEVGGLTAAQGNGPRWGASVPTDPEAADMRLLEEYLGSSRREELEQMSESDKAELLIQAKTKQFADRHGRHRQRFERKRTPPGFWRTDMPTTQEVEKDQMEAKKMEKEVVEERRREALKEGGRWMFRDE